MVIPKWTLLGFEVVRCSLSSLSLSHFRFRSVADTVVLARNLTRATLNFDHETHGVNKYVCEAKNKHGLTKIFLTVIIPGVYEPLIVPCVCACIHRSSRFRIR